MKKTNFIIKLILLLAIAEPIAANSTEIDDLFSKAEVILSGRKGESKLTEEVNQIVDTLVQGAKSDDPKISEKSFFLLRYSSPNRQVSDVAVEALSSENSAKINGALSLIKVHNLKDVETKEALVSVLSSTADNRVFSGASRIAGQLKTDKALPILERALKEGDTERKIGAVQGLVEYGGEAKFLIPVLEEVLNLLNNESQKTNGENPLLSQIPIKKRSQYLAELLETALITISNAEVSKIVKTNELVQVPSNQKKAAPQKQPTPEPTFATKTPKADKKPAELKVIESAPNNPFPYWIFIIGGVVAIGLVVILKRKK